MLKPLIFIHEDRIFINNQLYEFYGGRDYDKRKNCFSLFRWT